MDRFGVFMKEDSELVSFCALLDGAASYEQLGLL